MYSRRPPEQSKRALILSFNYYFLNNVIQLYEYGNRPSLGTNSILYHYIKEVKEVINQYLEVIKQNSMSRKILQGRITRGRKYQKVESKKDRKFHKAENTRRQLSPKHRNNRKIKITETGKLIATDQ